MSEKQLFEVVQPQQPKKVVELAAVTVPTILKTAIKYVKVHVLNISNVTGLAAASWKSSCLVSGCHVCEIQNNLVSVKYL